MGKGDALRLLSLARARAFWDYRRWSQQKKSFFFFGGPFIGSIIAASVLLSSVMQIKYDQQDIRVQTVDKKEQLKIDANRKPLNIQEEYFKLTSNKNVDDWDFVRLERPDGEEPVFKRS